MTPAAAVVRERAPGAVLGPATPADVEGIHRLIDGFAREGKMLPRSREELTRSLGEFVVVTDGAGRVRACGGLRSYGPGRAEIVGLAVDDGWRGRGWGRLVVEALVEEARATGKDEVFALTLEPGFFHGLGFETVSRARFPEKIRRDCVGCSRRNGCREITVARAVRESGEGRIRRTLPVLRSYAGSDG